MVLIMWLKLIGLAEAIMSCLLLRAIVMLAMFGTRPILLAMVVM